ncbi:MAG TPA: amidase, partial [Gammaproteobacteria bacterium]|nr:amidase [Gammaproteobacteria bacterium]
MTDLTFAAAVDIAAAIKSKRISSREITQHYIERIEALDESVNAVCVRVFEQALAAADQADEALARGEDIGPLHGVPMSIKESYLLADTPATWGIPACRDNVASADGLAVARFKAAGAHFLGKTNVPIDLGDFQSFNEIYGTTNNPWDLGRTPGGSSGGSAAALAAGFTALEAGSDIGGSIRTPAHFCGVFGHKPTWGIVPMQGHELMPGVPDPDLSVCGPLARDARDLRVAMQIM